MPNLAPRSPDSLTELLSLHSRPSSYDSKNNVGVGVCIPPSLLQGINSPLARRPRSRDHEQAGAFKPPTALQDNSGQSVTVGNGYRPGSREPNAICGTRPPRAPGNAISNGGAPMINSSVACQGDAFPNGANVPAAHQDLRRGNRPSSHPREGVCGSSPLHRQSSEPPTSLGVAAVAVSRQGVQLESEGEVTPRPVWMLAEKSNHSVPMVSTPAVSTSAKPWGLPNSARTVSFVSLAQDPNEGFRSYMEDGHHVVDPLMQCSFKGKEEMWGFFGVYDGHGGRKEVEYCEAKLHEVVLGELRGLPQEKDMQQAVKSSLVTAFHKIDSQLAMLGAWASGCTCTVAVTQKHGSRLTLHVANVGDSRAVIVGNVCAKRVSVDHRASDPEEARRVAQVGGIVRHGRVGGQLSVSRSLGDHHLKSSGVSCVPDVRSCEIEDDQAVVIASDGLWDALEDDDVHALLCTCIEQAITQADDPQVISKHLEQRAAQTLVHAAKERGSRDNILALVVFF